MDTEQTVFIMSQLVLGAIASFFGIILWSRTRETAWMLVIIGVIAAYVEIVYSILNLFGMGGGDFLLIGSIPIILFILPLLRMSFFIAAFILMVIRK